MYDRTAISTAAANDRQDDGSLVVGFANASQAACEVLEAGAPVASIAAVRMLISSVPNVTAPVHCLAVRDVLARILVAVSSSASINLLFTQELRDLLSAQSARQIRAAASRYTARLEGCLSTGTSRPIRSATARHILEAIRRDYKNPSLSVAMVSATLKLSPRHIAKLLKTTTNRTFLEHVHALRVFEAEHLLRDSTLSVKEIAFEVGYRRTSELDVHFRKLFGVTPTSYRVQFVSASL